MRMMSGLVREKMARRWPCRHARFFLAVVFAALGFPGFTGCASQRSAAVTTAQHSADSQPASPVYLGRTIAEIKRFPATVADSPPTTAPEGQAQLVALLKSRAKLERGAEVCEVGFGLGELSMQLAREVGPHGDVYGVEIQPDLITRLNRLATEEKLPNLHAVLGTETSLKLPQRVAHRGLDLIVIVNAYHEFSHPQEMLADMRASLRGWPRRGRVVVVEKSAETAGEMSHSLHFMTLEQIRREWTAAGFVIIAEDESLPHRHFVVLQAKR